MALFRETALPSTDLTLKSIHRLRQPEPMDLDTVQGTVARRNPSRLHSRYTTCDVLVSLQVDREFLAVRLEDF